MSEIEVFMKKGSDKLPTLTPTGSENVVTSKFAENLRIFINQKNFATKFCENSSLKSK